MNKIIPFKQDILFNTGIHEITSISLEHSFNETEHNTIEGTFTVNGEYRMTSTSINVDSFNKEVPFTIDIGENYKLDNINIDIDDFYYEILNDNYLSINIDLLIKNIEEIKEPDEIEREIIEESKTKEQEIVEEPRCVEEEIIMEEKPNDVYEFKEEELEENREPVIYNSFNDNNYSTYKIYILKEEETLENIMMKFEITKEALEKYNNLDNLQIGDKLIIPTNVRD